MRPRPFHYSFHVRDLDSTRLFYGRLLGCPEGRSASSWVDFDFFGNQLSAHLGEAVRSSNTGLVDGVAVPMPHFGAIIGWDELHQIALRAAEAGFAPLLGPLVRYPGQPGEQATVFLRDPSGNAIELKAFRDPSHVFTP